MGDVDLAHLIERANATAHAKGWYMHVHTFGDRIALMHSELSEALDEYRAGRKIGEVYAGDQDYMAPDIYDWQTLETLANNGVKPEGVPIELADTIIRILDFCGENKIDLEAAIRVKMAYNDTRPYRHGDKVM